MFIWSLTRGKIVLGYSETELCMKGSGYQFIHAADMMYCADNHMRSMCNLFFQTTVLLCLFKFSCRTNIYEV